MRARSVYEFLKTGDVRSSLEIGDSAIMRKKIHSIFSEIKDQLERVYGKDLFIIELIWPSNRELTVLFSYSQLDHIYYFSKFISHLDLFSNEEIESVISEYGLTISHIQQIPFRNLMPGPSYINYDYLPDSVKSLIAKYDLNENSDGGIIEYKFKNL